MVQRKKKTFKEKECYHNIRRMNLTFRFYAESCEKKKIF